MKFQVLGMSLFCAATLAAALPVEPSKEFATPACIPAEYAEFLLPGAPKDLLCKGKAQPEKRDGEPSQEECYEALVDYRSGNASEEEVGPLLDDCVAAYGPPPPENLKRQAKEPSILSGTVGSVIGDVSRVAGR